MYAIATVKPQRRRGETKPPDIARWAAAPERNPRKPEVRRNLAALAETLKYHPDSPAAQATTRTEAMKVADIPAARLRALNSGQSAATNLTESLAVDFQQLLKAIEPRTKAIIDAEAGIVQRMTQAGALFAGRHQEIVQHKSDTVRGWAAFAIAAAPNLTLQQRLQELRPLADDEHFGVREWAWLALRPHIAANLAESLRLLTPYAQEGSANLRRFSSEATRPRGVWCAHLGELKRDPTPGLAILDPLRADPSRYVQDSVANWLNDAAKTQPQWVRETCRRWQAQNQGPETNRIVHRALRSLK